jgi:hypothetical protein
MNENHSTPCFQLALFMRSFEFTNNQYLRCYKFPRLIRVVSIMAAIYTHMFLVILKVGSRSMMCKHKQTESFD